MQQDCKIGLVQMESLVGESEKNWNKMREIAEKAAKAGISILCYPEMALHGYSPTNAQKLAEPLTSQRVKQIVQCSRQLNITLLVGMAEHNKEGGKPYLAQLVTFPDGRIESYHKVHLGQSEFEYFSPGDKFPVFSSHGVNFAIGICWDWHFPEVATIYSLKGAEVLFAPHASPIIAGDRKELWLRYMGARAYDNSVYLAACNLTGQNGQGKEFSGGALVLGPKGELLEESFKKDEELLIVNLSAERINTLRSRSRTSMKDIFFLANRRKELYQELIDLDISEIQQ